MTKDIKGYGDGLAAIVDGAGWMPQPTPQMTSASAHLNVTTDIIVEDCRRVMRGAGEKLVSDVARRIYAASGGNPDCVAHFTEGRRRMMHNQIVNELHARLIEKRNIVNLTSTIEMLLSAKDHEDVIWTHQDGTVTAARAVDVRRAIGMPVEDFMLLEGKPREKILRHVSHEMRILRRNRPAAVDEKAASKRREALHKRLALKWAHSPLQLEKPTGSSLGKLLAYDSAQTVGSFARKFADDRCQIVLVENDWGAAVPPVEGEWRVPFPFMCWEFRLSGVRVLAFTDEQNQMWTVYGGDEGEWVCDDFYYDLGLPTLPRGISHCVAEGRDPSGDVEFRFVSARVYACIRSICIMMEAEVARRDEVRVPEKLATKRRREGKTPLRDYYVVRLVGRERYTRASHVRIAGSATVDRAPQRGHWRKGTWVHYDDQDSGQVQYVNDGGFIVSKSWRKWHFAGDPDNIIHREYRA